MRLFGYLEQGNRIKNRINPYIKCIFYVNHKRRTNANSFCEKSMSIGRSRPFCEEAPAVINEPLIAINGEQRRTIAYTKPQRTFLVRLPR